jgi:hypothetical protein
MFTQQAEERVARSWIRTNMNKLSFMVVGKDGFMLLQELEYPGAQLKLLEFPSAYSCSNRPDYFNPASKVLHAVGLSASRSVVYDAQLFTPPGDERTIVVCFRFEQIKLEKNGVPYAPQGHRWYRSGEIQKLMDHKSPTTVASPCVAAAMGAWQELIASLQPQPDATAEVAFLPPTMPLAKPASKPKPRSRTRVLQVAADSSVGQ